MVSLSDTLLMIPRELPSYLNVAYSIRYENQALTGNCISRVFQVAHRVFSLIKEIIHDSSSYSDFMRNRVKLEQDFEKINHPVEENEKPICVYFVSSHDHNGAILGNRLYYYHHYKIRALQEHFAVAPQVVSSQDEMKVFLESIKQKHPRKQIKFVDIVTHGAKASLGIHQPGKTPITPRSLRKDLFDDCAPDATILLDACSTGVGSKNIADEISRKNPGRTVLAAGSSMFFSKPVIQTKNNSPQVVGAVHGFALLNASICKIFSYTQKMQSQYPYVKDKFFKNDILSIAGFPVLQNA